MKGGNERGERKKKFKGGEVKKERGKKEREKKKRRKKKKLHSRARTRDLPLYSQPPTATA